MVKIKKLSGKTIDAENIRSWEIWEKEVSRFPWKYDSEEHCLIIEGEGVVETQARKFYIKAGDYVIFEKGLECTWNIIKDIRKYYKFM